MTTLLVGATGFLGSAVAERLTGRDAAAFVRPSSNLTVLPHGLPVRAGDLSDAATVERALAEVESLVWCASMGFGHVPPLVPLLETAGVKRAVFVSTTAIFTSLPARSRAPRMAAEEAVRQSRLDWTILRPTMIYGSARDRNISRLLRFLHRWPLYPLVDSGRALHQPVHVEDLANAVVAALDAPGAIRQTFNLAGARPIAYVDLVRAAGHAVGRRVRFVRLPLGLTLAVTRLLAASRLPRTVTPEQVLRLLEDKAFDWSDAARDLGFAPRSFEDGVRQEAALLGLAPVR